MPTPAASLGFEEDEITQEMDFNTYWAPCPDCGAICPVEGGLFLDGSKAVVCTAPEDGPGLFKWCLQHQRRYPTSSDEE